MKLRIRHKQKTSVLTLGEEGVSLGEVKSKVKQQCLPQLELSANTPFFLSLNGQSSLGNDSVLLHHTGVVSGDLLKIVVSDQNQSEEMDGRLPSTCVSMVSVGDPTDNQTSNSPTHNQTRNSPTDNQTSNNPTDIQTSNSPTDNQPSTSQNDHNRGTPLPGETECHHSGALLLRDYVEGHPLPQVLGGLYDLEGVKTDFHASCVLVHCLMLESGFNQVGVNVDAAPHFNEVLTSFVVGLEYVHPRAEGLRLSMTCNPLGPFTLVNALVRPCVNTEEQVSTMQIKVEDFVARFNGQTKPEDSSKVFRNLSKLSHHFKEGISYRALDLMREELQLPPVHGVLSLFPELLVRILSFLDVNSLCAVSQTCQTLQIIGGDESIWRNLYVRDFQALPNNTGSSPWKELYKRRYLHHQREEQERRQRQRDIDDFVPTGYFPPPQPLAPPFPGQPAGIIGGDYDLDPAFPYGPLTGRRPRPRNPFGGPNPGGNPLPGSRYDPMNPFGGGFRPGRGGGMMDPGELDPLDPLTGLPRRPRRGQRNNFDDFGGFM